MPTTLPIPAHLAALEWYRQHQAWLRDMGLDHHDPGEAVPIRGWSANELGDNMSGAILNGSPVEGMVYGVDFGRAVVSASGQGALLQLAACDLSDSDWSLPRVRVTARDCTFASAQIEYLERWEFASCNLGGMSVPDAPTPVDLIDVKVLDLMKSEGTMENQPNWPKCGTTLCHAGWTVRAAGDEGEELQAKYGWNVAATLIYAQSRDGKTPDFDATPEEALASIKSNAAAQLAAAV